MPGPPVTAGLVLSLDASLGVFKDTGKTTAATLAGDLIALWADQSGNGNDVQQATSGNRPNLQPNILSSLPVVRFAGSPVNYLSNTQVLSSQAQTVFIVYSTTDRNVQNVLFGEGGANQFNFYQNNGGPFTLYDGSAHAAGNGTITALRGFQVITLITTSTQATIHQNGAYLSTILSGLLANNSLTNFVLGCSSTGTLPLFGDVAEVLVYNSTLSGANITAVENYLLAKYSLPASPSTAVPLVVTEGDSLTNGTNTSSNTQEWPERAFQAINPLANYVYVNPSVGGSQFTDLTNRATYVDSLYNSARGNGKNILVVWCGTNDIWLGSQTAAQTQTRLQTYCLARRAVGWKIVVVTMLPRQYTTNAGNETIRQAYNTWIRSNYASFADVLCDPGADIDIGQAQQDANTTYYAGDRIHLTPAGQGIIAAYLTSAITKAIATNPTGGLKRVGFTGGISG